MRPEWAVERDSNIVGTHGHFRTFIRVGPVAAGCLIECECGMGAKVVVRFLIETVELHIGRTERECDCQVIHKPLGIQMPKCPGDPQPRSPRHCPAQRPLLRSSVSMAVATVTLASPVEASPRRRAGHPGRRPESRS